MKEDKQVADWKKREVQETVEMIKGKSIVALINIESLPSAQFQEIRKKLRGKAEIRITKTILIQKAIEETKNEKLKQLEKYIDKKPIGILTSNENPFKLYRFIKQNRSKTTAKPGMIAPMDLIAPAGETDIPVGPALSEMKMAKIDCKVDKGKIVISKDSIVTKKGEVVTEQASSALSKLGITPMEIGLDILVVCENGMIYTPDVLNIDDEAFMSQLKQDYLNAINLSVFIGYITKANIQFMLQKASQNALNLALNSEIANKKTVPYLLGKANASMNGLKSVLASKGYS